MRNLQPLSNRMEAARGSNLAQVKTQQMAREGEEKVRLKRVKGTIVLIEQFLLDQGYSQALQALQTESQVSLSQYCAADNMDLLSIISEFENYYEFKFQHRPKLFRLTNADHDGVRAVTEGCENMLVRKRHTTAPTSAPPALTYATADDRMSASPDAGAGCGRLLGQLRPAGALSRALGRIDRSEAAASPVTSPRKEKGKSGGTRALNLDVQKISCAPGVTAVQEEADDGFTGRGLKPLPRFASSELTELAAVIQRDILDVNPSVHWSDIADLESAKHLLKEAVVMPVKYPELFEGILRPWKGILLFGPPGTGKTLLAKAVATECRTTFFNISASSVVSKWRGDSEKLVRLLFDLAVHYAPSTIFIDEIDSLMSARSSEGEHEGSRRMKTELLIQMDGLSKRQGGDVVFVLAASNVPWDLDTAMLRRLEKRILVSLPTEAARGQMFQRLLHKHASQDGTMSWSECAKLTDGMSGADIDVVCREAMMRPIRKMIVKLETCPPSDRHELEKYRLEKPRVSLEDVKASIACTKSSVRGADLAKYDLWATQYGSGMSV